MKMTKQIQGKDKVFFGTRKEDGRRIYISKPTFDCSWYWSFGYLGNAREHYHLSSYQEKQKFIKDSEGKYHVLTEKRNKNMVDCLSEDYDLSDTIKENIWAFCELAETIYSLKEIAKIYYRGGSHYTTNPSKSILQNKEKYLNTTFEVLPELLQTFWNLIGGNQNES